jgi:hypothetical protein
MKLVKTENITEYDQYKASAIDHLRKADEFWVLTEGEDGVMLHSITTDDAIPRLAMGVLADHLETFEEFEDDD